MKVNWLTKTLFWLLFATVTVLSLMPMQQLPPQLFDWWDKAQHCLAFLTLTCMAVAAYSSISRLATGMYLLVYGLAVELIQHWLAWRHGDLLDLLADATGIGVALVVLAVVTPARGNS